MSRSGSLTLYHPGQDVSVELMADASGNVAGRNDAVELVGDGTDHPQAALNGTDGGAIGRISEMPEEHTEGDTYDANESVGTATLDVDGAVKWLNPADAYTPSVGEKVVWAAGGGVRAYDPSAAPGAEDTADMPVGEVFTTGTRDFHQAGKVAVYMYR